MSDLPDTPGVLLINFGEPETPDPDEVERFLERIFLANADIEKIGSVEAARARSRQLARRRAPGLVADYEKIGGSPLNRQANAQAEALDAELTRRGRSVAVACGMQFTAPTIADGLRDLRDSGVDAVTVLPVYPLCGPSTTVAALEAAARAAEAIGWAPRVLEVSGWHAHPGYIALRAKAIAERAVAAEVDLGADDVELVFSAHGTPMVYVERGSRYVDYVEDSCRRVAARLGLDRYTLAYQNHSNRGVEWTAPDVDDAVAALAGSRSAVVVDAVSFVHEQSETLAELDVDLREVAETAGLGFHRVPVPHAAPELATVLADLVEASWGESPALPELRRCVCRPGASVCLNGEIGADLPTPDAQPAG